MSFNYGSGGRHRTSGRHFKLFSDELPRIEFDRASFEDFNNATAQRRTKGKRRTFRDSNQDRHSLPSLGTPELDRLSEADKLRPQSYSSLNPNFAKIHQKITRRHTLRETKVNEWTHVRPNDSTVLPDQNDVDKEQYTKAWHEKVRGIAIGKKGYMKTEEEESSDEKQTSFVSNEEKRVLEKPPIPKKKSLFKELLDASAKEQERINRIKEGLQFYDHHNKIQRHQSMKPYRLERLDQNSDNFQNSKPVVIRLVDENAVPEIISKTNDVAKPGILKHGVRVRENNVLKVPTKKDFNMKPRLVHQEDLPLFGSDIHNGASSAHDEVRVSVYADTPMNRMNDMMFVPLPSNKPKDKQKKVNFHEHVDVKERTAMSELIEVEAENQTEVDETAKATNSDMKMDTTPKTCERLKNSANIRRRSNVKYKSSSKAPVKQNYSSKRGHESTLGTEAFIPHYSKGGRVSYQDHGDKQNYIDSILLSSKPISPKNRDVRMDPAWKHAKPAVSEVLIHDSEPTEATAVVDSTIEPSSSSRNKPMHSTSERNDSRAVAHLPVLNFPDFIGQMPTDTNAKTPPRSPVQSTPRSPPRSPRSSPPKSPDVDSMAEISSWFGPEFDLDDFSDEIDRSILGEDLIKAYRFWDRKKKAFVGGLRKIEAPTDKNDPLYPKQYGSVKTYKIANPKLDKPTVPATSNKSSLQSVVTEWV